MQRRSAKQKRAAIPCKPRATPWGRGELARVDWPAGACRARRGGGGAKVSLACFVMATRSRSRTQPLLRPLHARADSHPCPLSRLKAYAQPAPPSPSRRPRRPAHAHAQPRPRRPHLDFRPASPNLSIRSRYSVGLGHMQVFYPGRSEEAMTDMIDQREVDTWAITSLVVHLDPMNDPAVP